MATELQSYVATWLRGYGATELLGYVATELRSYMATELLGYRLKRVIVYPARRIKSCYGVKRVRGQCGICKATRQFHGFLKLLMFIYIINRNEND